MNKFFPYYQPIIDLSDGRIKGYEALGRTFSSGRVVSAGPIFIGNDLPQEYVLAIDRHIRRLALENHHLCKDSGFITLNISPTWIGKLEQDAVVPTINMIHEIGIEPERVIIEITEIGGDIEKLKRLRAIYRKHGLRVAIDDFGVGASQLDRVAELEPDFIKLDMGLLKMASKGGFKADVVLSLNVLTRRTGCQIICEGVETEEEFHFAIECGADFIQGWIFSPALEKSIDSDVTVPLTRELKTTYLNRKRNLVNRSVTHNQRVFQCVAELSDKIKTCGKKSCEECLFRHDGLCNEVETALDIGILRYYICDLNADQISPNYELLNKLVQKDYSLKGKNWSHRPYFPLILEIQKISAGKVVVSEPYRDRASGQLCKTYMSYVAPDMILMVDVLVEDMVLFAG